MVDPDVGTVTGAVLVTDGPSPEAGVPYLGSGSLLARCDKGGENIFIQIREGRFFFRSACLGTLSVIGLELSALPTQLEGRQELVPGEENIVRFSWASLSIRLSVREQGSARELPRVSVWSVAKLLSSDSFGSPDIGPGEGDTAVLRGAQSPVALLVPEGRQHAEFWITHEGFVPFLYRFPTGLPDSEVIVTLEPSRTIEVTVESSTVGDYVVNIYEVADAPLRPVGKPLRSIAAKEEMLISELPANRFAVTLEGRTTGRPKPIDEAFVDLTQATCKRISLSQSGAGSEAATGKVTFIFSGEGLGDDVLALGAEILPLSLSVLGQQNKDPLTVASGLRSATGEWGPIELLAGEYALRASALGQVFRFSVREGSKETHAIRLLTCRPHYFTFIDGETGAAVPLRAFRWSAPTTLSGEVDLDNSFGMLDAKELGQPVEVVAPSTQVLVQVFTDGYGNLRQVVDLDKESDPVITLHAKTCLEIVPGRVDQTLDAAWLGRVRVLEGGKPVTIGPVEVRVQDEAVLGRIFFSGKGSMEIHLPPLSSYGDVPAISVEFEAGQIRQLVLADQILAHW